MIQVQNPLVYMLPQGPTILLFNARSGLLQIALCNIPGFDHNITTSWSTKKEAHRF
jgi:hypothetical protein